MSNATATRLSIHTVTVNSPRGVCQVNIRGGRIELDFQGMSADEGDTLPSLWPDEHAQLAELIGCTEAEAKMLVDMLLRY